MSGYDRELETAARIAREGAALVRSFHRKKMVIEAKAGNEPVTEADRAANALIVERLAAAFPADPILSEEIPDTGARLGKSRIWMVDPIDGTSDFILGDTGFVVMIGLCIDGRPTVDDGHRLVAFRKNMAGQQTSHSSAEHDGRRSIDGPHATIVS